MAPDTPKKRKRSPYLSTENTILVQILATKVPHDSPEFIEHAKKGRPASAPPIPDWMRRKPTDTPGAEPQQG